MAPNCILGAQKKVMPWGAEAERCQVQGCASWWCSSAKCKGGAADCTGRQTDQTFILISAWGCRAPLRASPPSTSLPQRKPAWLRQRCPRSRAAHQCLSVCLVPNQSPNTTKKLPLLIQSFLDILKKMYTQKN